MGLRGPKPGPPARRVWVEEHLFNRFKHLAEKEEGKSLLPRKLTGKAMEIAIAELEKKPR